MVAIPNDELKLVVERIGPIKIRLESQRVVGQL